MSQESKARSEVYVEGVPTSIPEMVDRIIEKNPKQYLSLLCKSGGGQPVVVEGRVEPANERGSIYRVTTEQPMQRDQGEKPIPVISEAYVMAGDILQVRVLRRENGPSLEMPGGCEIPGRMVIS